RSLQRQRRATDRLADRAHFRGGRANRCAASGARGMAGRKRQGHRHAQGRLPEGLAQHPDRTGCGHGEPAAGHACGRADRAPGPRALLPIAQRRAEGALQRHHADAAAKDQRDLTRFCDEKTPGVTDLPIDRIAQAVQPTPVQRAALAELKDASVKAAEGLKVNCPTYQTLTPTGRVEAMEKRLDATLTAVKTVQPALAKFYNSLSDEQKARFNSLRSPSKPVRRRRACAFGHLSSVLDSFRQNERRPFLMSGFFSPK